MADNKKIAADVLEALGGKDNITFAAHCMTRLRFNLKDMELPDINAVKKVNGVIGAQISGGQFQVIIGQNVPKVYDELIKMSGLAKQESIDENLDASGVKTPLTPAAVGNAILNYLSGSMVPMIPLLLASGMFKTVAVVLGPTMLNLIADTSDLYVLLNMLYNVTFYFIPVFLGFSAAKNIAPRLCTVLLWAVCLSNRRLCKWQPREKPLAFTAFPACLKTMHRRSFPFCSQWP